MSPPGDLIRAFWLLVVMFNVSLLATTIGVLLVAFEHQLVIGLSLIIIGLAIGIRGYQRYIHYRYHHTFTHQKE